jgi:hypothetical protein
MAFAWMPINILVDTDNLEYKHSGLLFSHKEKEIIMFAGNEYN